MSTMQNASTMSSICNTREPLWAEDFIDLSEFCQPSTIPTKMEDLADEHVTSPISSTVHDHGFDYSLEVNDGLDNTIEDTFWCMGSPIDAMQEELCDPISDWLSVTSKETNNNSNTNNNNHIGILNDNPCSRSQIYNIGDTLLNSTFTSSVPKIALAPAPSGSSAALTTAYHHHHHHQQQRKDHHVNLLSSPPLQPDTTFFDSILNMSDVPSSNDHLPLESLYQKSTRTNAPASAAALFATEKIPDTTFTTNAFRSSHQQSIAAAAPQSSSSSPPLIVAEDTRAPAAPVLNRVTAADTSVSSPCSVQSPSITQSNLNTNLDSSMEKHTASGIINRRNVKLKLKMEETPRTSCSLNTPEMLQPLVTKNSEFDLVSFVFDENKPSLPFDVSSLHNNNNSSSSSNNVATKDTISAISGAGTETTFATTTVVVPKTSPINIKIEPKEEQIDEPQQQSNTTTDNRIGVKRAYETDDSYDFETSSKRSRRYSNVSQLDLDDLTQLESEKYRELRNRNNEASRRSRANRKSREVEMRDHASKLESENRRLKVKAEEMEKLVKRLRNCLMQLVLKRR
ncbi:probable myosin light chain kinase DDB_G0279831 [Planococcus citri]|uniref:probable myosin light chain kinase DDB_G0279831 n=1 Tax=Planococcus citri TaxID=170843 RepID=UPI0031F75D2C